MCGPQIQHDLRTHSIDVYPQKRFDDDINDRLLNSKIRVGGPGGLGSVAGPRWVTLHSPLPSNDSSLSTTQGKFMYF